MIKICFVTREYAHPEMGKTGGIGVFVKHYLMELQSQANVSVFSFGPDKRNFRDQEVSVIKIKDLSGFNESLQTYYRKTKLPGYITLKLILAWINRLYISSYLSFFALRKKFDIIEFHDYGGDAPYFIGSSKKVIRCHGSAVTLSNFMGYPERKTDIVFEKVFFKHFNRNVIGVSNYAAITSQTVFALPKKPKVIYNGVSLPSVLNKDSYLASPTIPFSIFYFGSIRERKGIDIACSVFNEIIQKHPFASFHVLGNNNNDYWNTCAKKILIPKAKEATTYYGVINNDKINCYLEKAHVVMFPSYGENFSIALLEVMALGKVVVTSNIPSFQEIIKQGQNGFIEDKNEDFVKRISKLFANEELVHQIGMNARNTIAQDFQWKDLVQQNMEYYKSILNE